MCEELAPLLRREREIVCAKDNALAHGVGASAYGACRFRCLWVGVNANVAEIMSEARFHEGARFRIQRLTRRAQCFLDDGRRCIKPRLLKGSMQHQAFGRDGYWPWIRLFCLSGTFLIGHVFGTFSYGFPLILPTVP
jgi:hypothetical protein